MLLIRGACFGCNLKERDATKGERETPRPEIEAHDEKGEREADLEPAARVHKLLSRWAEIISDNGS